MNLISKGKQYFAKTHLIVKLLLLVIVATFATNVSAAQTVKGKVIDTNGEPLIGVTVSVSGSYGGGLTDINGNYSVSVPDGNAVLTFSYLGFNSQEIKVGNQTQINVTLSESSQALGEVVVVGYGTQKKATLTGSVSQVAGKDVVSKTNTDALTALQGQMPSVTVLRTSGQPGNEATSTSLRIRGFSSANDANALILIDGVEGDLRMVKSEDIESISVLKDAASAAIYGARAAAGVVLVKTKQGRATDGSAKISYNGSFGVNLPGNMPQRMSSWEEQEFINISRVGRGAEQTPEQTSWIGNPNYNYRPNGARWDARASSNWLNEGTNDYTTQQSHAVSASGGSGKTLYYVSAGYYTKNGLMKYGADDYSRYNLRANLSTELNKYLDFSLQASYQNGHTAQSSVGSASLLSTLYTARARQLIYLPKEDSNYDVNPYSADLQRNAIEIMKYGGENNQYTTHFIGNFGLHVKNLVKGLTIDLNASRDAGYYSQEIDGRHVAGMGRNGEVRGGGAGAYSVNNPRFVTKSKYNSYQDKLEALINYDLKIDDHAITLLAGASYEQYLKDQITGTTKNLLSNDFFSFNYYDSGTASNSVLSDLVQPWKMASLFGRVHYDYAGRYLAEATIRRDGSSRLAPGDRFGNFPSASAAWRVSEEKFFESLKEAVDNLKLRLSWGQLGNSTVLNSTYYPYYGLISNSTIFGTGRYYQDAMASTSVTWETITTTNIGIDVNALNNRLGFTADYYWKRNSDMLANMQVGHIVGVTVPTQNVGELKTWGWEIGLSWADKIGEVKYRVGVSLDDSQNKLVKYDGASVITAGTVTLLEGYPLNSLWGYETDGFWSSRQEYLDYKAAHPGYQIWNDANVDGGDVKFLPQGNNDHVIGIGDGTPENHGDLVYLGSADPRYLYGFTIDLQWRRFDFSIFFQGVGKRSLFINADALAPLYYSYEMPWTVHRDYWREDNPNAYFARPYEPGSATGNYQYADRWLQNGAYLRLKNIQLGYTIPVIKNYISSLRVFVSGADVWEHTNMLKVFDPEVKNQATKQYYPFFRTWTTGISVTF